LGSLTKSQTFSPDEPEPYKSRIGNKYGENVVFKSQELYYIVSMNYHYKFNLVSSLNLKV